MAWYAHGAYRSAVFERYASMAYGAYLGNRLI